MTIWTVEPRDTVVLRDGRPIAEGAGRMRTLPMPWPSSIAGLARTRAGTTREGAWGMTATDARAIPVRGPWIVDLAASADAIAWWAPAPADAAWLRPEGMEDSMCRRLRLAPQGVDPGCETDLPGMRILNFASGATIRGKPCRAPTLWHGAAILDWLFRLTDETDVHASRTRSRSVWHWQGHGTCPLVGIGATPVESRTHVKIDASLGTADEGNLFVTEALRTTARTDEPVGRLAFAFAAEHAGIAPGVVVLGGERRPSFLREGGAHLAPADTAVGTIPDTAATLRVVLLTPAIFDEGSVPASIHGARVVAAAVGRAEHISGWDLDARGPKPVRRAAPAGSVYWVEVPGPSAAAWAADVWMRCVSSGEQDRLDGFGLALVGVA